MVSLTQNLLGIRCGLKMIEKPNKPRKEKKKYN